MELFLVHSIDVFLSNAWFVWGLGMMGLIGLLLFVIRWWSGTDTIRHTIVPRRKKTKKRFTHKNKTKALDQLPLLLQGMGRVLQSGGTLHQSISIMAQEMPEPIRWYVEKMDQSLQLQVAAQDVFRQFATSLPHPHTKFLSESIVLQIESGGDLVQLLDQVRVILEEHKKLARDQKSFTSQGKLSGIIIAGLWPLSLLFFMFFAPKQTEILFATTAGNVLLGFALLLEGIGFWWIRRIIHIKI